MLFHRYYLEIRSRIFLLFSSWSAIIFMSYSFKDILLSTLVSNLPTESTSFIFTDVMEVFSVHLNLCLFFSNQILVIFLFYHVFLFVLPSLTLNELDFLTFIFLASIFLLLVSVFIFNVLLFPLSWDFFLSFQSFGALETFSLSFEAKLSDFYSFYTEFYFICVIYFQIFLIPMLFLRFVKVNFDSYPRFRKLLCYFCVIFSTVVTPPDVFSQIIVSLCLIFCCEVLVYFAILTEHFFLIRQPIKTC